MSTFRFGRNPPVHTRRTMRLALRMHAALSSLGTPPATSDDYVTPTLAQLNSLNQPVGGPWGMFLNGPDGNPNDPQLGDCLTEDTLICSSGVRAAFKMPYRGPIVTLRFESGKRLSVTANHQVLTKHGFVAAKDLKQFDYAISAFRPDMFPISAGTIRKSNVYRSPAKAADIFSALSLSGFPLRVVMPHAINFHGDQHFGQRNIEIVSANRELRNDIYPSLKQPNGKHQVSATRELQCFLHRLRSAMHRGFRSYSAALSAISGMNDRLAFYLALPYPSGLSSFGNSSNLVPCQENGPLKCGRMDLSIQSQRIERLATDIPLYPRRQISTTLGNSFVIPTESVGLKASRDKSSSNGLMSSAEFASKILNSLAGKVSLDRIIDVEVSESNTHVYEVSTDEHWYCANGIITHNCTTADSAHQVMLHSANGGSIIVPTLAQVKSFYSATSGWDPNNSAATDNGADETTVCAYLESNGMAGVKSVATAPIDPTNLDHLKWAVQIFGAVRLGIICNNQMMNAFSALQPWTTAAAANDPSAGGHDIPGMRYDPDYLYPVTWGGGSWPQGLQPVAWSLVANSAWLIEAHVDVFPDFVRAGGTAPNGLDLDQLLADLQAVEMSEAA